MQPFAPSRNPVMTRPWRVIPGGIAVVLFVAACGGGSASTNAPEPSESPTSATAATATAPPVSSRDTKAGDGPSMPSGPAGSGFVDIGGARYDVRVLDCVQMAGAIGGRFVGADDPDNISGDYSFAPQDWQSRPQTEGWEETGDVSLKIEDPYTQWETGYSRLQDFNFPAGITAEDLVVTAAEIDATGSVVSGEAMFVDTVTLFSGDSAPTPGTFQFSCP